MCQTNFARPSMHGACCLELNLSYCGLELNYLLQRELIYWKNFPLHKKNNCFKSLFFVLFEPDAFCETIQPPFTKCHKFFVLSRTIQACKTKSRSLQLARLIFILNTCLFYAKTTPCLLLNMYVLCERQAQNIVFEVNKRFTIELIHQTRYWHRIGVFEQNCFFSLDEIWIFATCS